MQVFQVDGKGSPEQDIHSLGTEVGRGGVASLKRTLATDAGNVTMKNLAVMANALLLVGV